MHQSSILVLVEPVGQREKVVAVSIFRISVEISVQKTDSFHQHPASIRRSESSLVEAYELIKRKFAEIVERRRKSGVNRMTTLQCSKCLIYLTGRFVLYPQIIPD